MSDMEQPPRIVTSHSFLSPDSLLILSLLVLSCYYRCLYYHVLLSCLSFAYTPSSVFMCLFSSKHFPTQGYLLRFISSCTDLDVITAAIVFYLFWCVYFFPNIYECPSLIMYLCWMLPDHYCIKVHNAEVIIRSNVEWGSMMYSNSKMTRLESWNGMWFFVKLNIRSLSYKMATGYYLQSLWCAAVGRTLHRYKVHYLGIYYPSLRSKQWSALNPHQRQGLYIRQIRLWGRPRFVSMGTRQFIELCWN